MQHDIFSEETRLTILEAAEAIEVNFVGVRGHFLWSLKFFFIILFNLPSSNIFRSKMVVKIVA